MPSASCEPCSRLPSGRTACSLSYYGRQSGGRGFPSHPQHLLATRRMPQPLSLNKDSHLQKQPKHAINRANKKKQKTFQLKQLSRLKLIQQITSTQNQLQLTALQLNLPHLVCPPCHLCSAICPRLFVIQLWQAFASSMTLLWMKPLGLTT